MASQVFSSGPILRGTRLTGVSLSLARGAWLIIVLLSFALFVLALPVQYRSQIATAQTEYAAALKALRLTPQFYAGFLVAMDFIMVTAFTLLGILIHIRRQDDWMVLLISTTSITFGMMFVPTLWLLSQENPIWQFPTGLVRAVGLALSLLAPFYLFPDGRFVPRLTVLLSVIWVGLVIAWLLVPGLPANLVHVTTWDRYLAFSFALYLFWYATGVVAQVYRYRKVSGVIERQQTKWVVLGTGGAVAGFILYHVPLLVFPDLSTPTVAGLMYAFIGGPLYKAAILLAPTSLGISILRYRLWDVDLVINRSVVYTILMVTLGVIFLGALLSLRVFIFRLTGETARTLTTIASTLLISALFNPLRSVIQAAIDRRFFRKKYNAVEVLAGFGSRLRKEVDLDALTRDVLAVVDETVQPESVSLWIKPVLEPDPGWDSAAAVARDPARRAMQVRRHFGQ